MNKVFHIFKIKREERWLAIFIFMALVFLNALVACKYYDLFTPISDHYFGRFVKNFHISGFDPLTYYVLSNWETSYNVYRHPLLAFFMYIPYLINMGLMQITGINCALFIAIAIQMFCSFYATIFMKRIFKEVIGLQEWVSQMMAILFFSIGYVMVTSIVPDHFVISMMLLVLALYVSGRRIKNHHHFKIWQSIVYFLLTAGVSLNNGLKIFLSALFVNGKAFFRPKHLLLAVILPAALLWGFCHWEYKVFVWPRKMEAKAIKAKQKAEEKAKQIQLAQLQKIKDSLAQDSVKKGLKIPVSNKEEEKTTTAPKKVKKIQKVGHPFMPGEFMGWSDATTDRKESIIENLMGESIQLHQEHLLEDELLHRPMIVKYTHWWNYAVELLVTFLFILGIWMGRKSKYLWLVMSYFGMDMLLHIGLGFSINEVYIMTVHWVYAIPIAIGFLIKGTPTRYTKYLLGIIASLTLYLLIYNGSLIISYLV